jgi:hypothetical protein
MLADADFFQDVVDAKVHDIPVPQYKAALQQVMLQTLQLLAAKAEVAAARAAAASARQPPAGYAAAPAAANNAQLQLQSFTSNYLATPAVVHALPAHSLTCLELAAEHCAPVNGPVMAAALAQLSKLQQLVLINGEEDHAVPASCLAGLSCLTQLTALTLRGYWGEGWQEQLAQPLQLRELTLQQEFAGDFLLCSWTCHSSAAWKS